jgi:hypothetical protein
MSTPGALILRTNGTTERMRIDASGNVGIGTASPSVKLQVSGGTASITNSTTAVLLNLNDTTTNNIQFGTSSDGFYVSNTANKAIWFATNSTERMRIAASGVSTFSAATRGTVSALTDAATITPDFAVANNFSLTIGGNRTLANPTNLAAGQSGAIVITQDSTGGRTLAYGSYWKWSGGTVPTLTTTASAVDVIVYYTNSTTSITATMINDVK